MIPTGRDFGLAEWIKNLPKNMYFTYNFKIHSQICILNTKTYLVFKILVFEILPKSGEAALVEVEWLGRRNSVETKRIEVVLKKSKPACCPACLQSTG